MTMIVLALALSALAAQCAASQRVFSVHDDVLAFPQYKVIFSESFVTHSEADSLLKNGKHDVDTGEKLLDVSYELMRFGSQPYVCSVPMVEVNSLNKSAEASARAEEEKELARASDRGWDLLRGLEGQCLYFFSGWWSYEFCHNRKVKQFHQQLPPRGQSIPFPPVEDKATPAFVLGRAGKSEGSSPSPRDEKPESEVAPQSNSPADVQVKGETRYLVQKLGQGTVCDLTNRPRTVEVQYRCNPAPPDRIGWIKEVTTCAYLMVVDTPRLCDDVAFLPPRQDEANGIACREIVSDDGVEEAGRRAWERNQDAQTQGQGQGARKGEKAATIGGVKVGGKIEVGKEGKRIDAGFGSLGGRGRKGDDTKVIAEQVDGDVHVDEAEVSRLELDMDEVEEWREELEQFADGRGWKIEVVQTEGEKKIRGIVETEDDKKEKVIEDAEDTHDNHEQNEKEGGDIKHEDSPEVVVQAEEVVIEQVQEHLDQHENDDAGETPQTGSDDADEQEAEPPSSEGSEEVYRDEL